jgi:hypothetical protein
MDLFILDKIIIGVVTSLTWEKIFIYSLGLLCGVYYWIGTHKMKVRK